MSVQNSGSSMLTTTATSQPGAPVKAPRHRNRLALRLLRDRRALTGVVILVIFVVVALAAPLLSPGNPRSSVAAGSESPSFAHLLGTTSKGEDVLALLIWGSRSSLGIGFTVGALATLVGLLIGLTSAYFGRAIDDFLSVVTNIFLLIPGLPLLIILAAFLPPGPGTIVVVLVITGWA